ncbi:TIGR02594 family protein [Rhizobiales bacterium GAS191]|nr:TIGR02594 family protein [Rhizobiales bacterium GAS113]SED76186.1 TIGR02594 family protein [Rhizobiales bacterium GAS191]SEE69789.1 TIGR02594 family protein [Rhizobiales bacterium GAS188]
MAQAMTGGRLDRRAFMFGGIAVPALFSASVPCAAAAAKPIENYRDFESAELPPPMVGGTQVPLETETTIADRILRAAPRTSPFAVMRYLEAVRRVNKDREAYNGGWKTRWNPVIVTFFEDTSTTPQGDTTSWCAASLNWTLARAGYRGGTSSASSGSFRDAPGRTNRPRPGDIVVFGHTDPQAFAAGRGHVGLFVAQRHDAVLVLGGNQTNRFGHHSFCRKWLAKSGEDLKLHSFHAIDALKQQAA